MITDKKAKEVFLKEARKDGRTFIKVKIRDNVFENQADHGDLFFSIKNLRGSKKFFYIPYSLFIHNSWEHQAIVTDMSTSRALDILDIYDEVVEPLNEKDAKVSLLNHIMSQINKLVLDESRFINASFKKSSTLGKAVLSNAITAFSDYLSKKNSFFLKSSSYEYRAFIIGILKNTDKEFSKDVFSEILVPTTRPINNEEMLNILMQIDTQNIELK